MLKKFLTATLAATMLILAPVAAQAADLHVETTGTDSVTCGPTLDPCASLAQATTNAVSGDRVLIGDGTFVQTDAVRPVDKSIEYIGNGPANTILTANGSNAFLTAGMFRFQWNNRDYAVKDLTMEGLPSTNAGSANRFGIYAQPTHPTPAPNPSTYGLDLIVDNVAIVGNTGTPAKTENGVYVAVNAGTATVTNSTVTNVMGNSLLFEQQQGALTVSGNTITKPLSSSGAVVVLMAHADSTNTNPYNITGAQTITNNSITAGAGVMVLTGWPYTAGFGPSAILGGLTIEDNDINTTTSASSAIDVLNTTNANDGTPGRIENAEINHNTLTGAGTGNGIRLQGFVPNADIEFNNIRSRSNGVMLQRHTRIAAPNPGTFDHVPTGAVINGNQIVDNNSGVTTDPGTTITADLNGNWWGCNEGPSVAASPTPGDCDTVTTPNAGSNAPTTWITLRIAANPVSELATAGVATTSAGFDQLNTNAPAPNAFADGTVLPMSATGGTLATSTPTLSSLMTGNTFTSTAAVGRSASATFDHETVTHTWNDDVTPPVVTITTPADNAFLANSPATINYTVTDFGGGVTCNIADGDAVPLTVGANSIVVSCTDAAGNVGYDSVAVTYDPTPPVVTILSPTNGSVTNSASTSLFYSVADATATTCTPANGANVALGYGTNTITVTCTDAAGNVGTASVTVSRPDALPQCAKDVVITDVTRVGSRTRIRGVARTEFAGKSISIQYQPTGTKVVGKATVTGTGAFQITVSRPSRPAWTSNGARYRAILGSTTTSWIKLSRRMGATAVTYDGNGQLTVSGSVSLPIAKGQPLRVQRSDACGKYRQIGSIRVQSDGTFKGSVPTGGASNAAVFIRLQARVAKASNPRYRFNTYSIVQPIAVDK